MLRAERSELRRTNLSLRRTRSLKGKFNKEYAREYPNVGHAILYTTYDVVLESPKDFRATTVSLGMSLSIRSFWVNASTRLKRTNFILNCKKSLSRQRPRNTCPSSFFLLPSSTFFCFSSIFFQDLSRSYCYDANVAVPKSVA